MNRSHVNILNYLPIHSNKDSLGYIPINGMYIYGFIADNGSIGIFEHNLTLDSPNFYRIYLSLTQHKNKIIWINEIKYNFYVEIKTKVQTNNRI